MLSLLISLIVLHQLGKGFEINPPVNHFNRHSQCSNHPECGIHSDIFPGLQIDDGLTVASRFFRKLLLTVLLCSAQLS